MQNEKKKTRKNWPIIWTVLSLVVHVCFFYLKFNFSFSPTIDKQKTTFEYIDQQKLEEIKQKIINNKLKNTVKQQIVNSEQVGEAKKPENARFLGEKDQSVDRQTIAKKVESFNKAGLGSSEEETLKNTKSKPLVKKEKSAAPKNLKLSDLGFGDTVIAKDVKKNSIEDEKQKKAGIKNGDFHSRGIASNNDYINDLPLGDKTALNTVEYKYFGFYNRIRQKLEQHWGRSLREKAKNIYDKGRKLAREEDYITSVKLTLDTLGNIVHIKIIGTSGVQELDDAALESFNKAGPFPNPPKGMLKNGQTTIEWGFVVRS